MQNSRRNFLKKSALLATGIGISKATFPRTISNEKISKPIVISTWNHGLPANEAAWKVLQNGGKALDAVEAVVDR